MAGNFQRSADAEQIEASVIRRDIPRVYHFTPLQQVAGILEHGGIHPRGILRSLGVSFNDDSTRWSPSRQKSEELAGYVAVGVARAWGMMQREPDCVVFGLDRRLLWRLGTSFIGFWSSSNEISGLEDVRARQTIDYFNEMFDNPTSSFPAPPPGECLVEGSIPLTEITALYVRDAEHGQRVRNAVAAAHISYTGPTIKLVEAAWIFGR